MPYSCSFLRCFSAAPPDTKWVSFVATALAGDPALSRISASYPWRSSRTGSSLSQYTYQISSAAFATGPIGGLRN